MSHIMERRLSSRARGICLADDLPWQIGSLFALRTSPIRGLDGRAFTRMIDLALLSGEMLSPDLGHRLEELLIWLANGKEQVTWRSAGLFRRRHAPLPSGR